MPSWTTVWPALLPPWERITMSVRPARMSITLPLPSSPHWPPTRIATGMSVLLVDRRRRLVLGRPRRGAPGGRLAGGVDEAGLALDEHQGHLAGGSVAVLGDDQLGLVALDPGGMQAFPAQEDEHAG